MASKIESSSSSSSVQTISYITQKEAAEIDELLMGPLGFSVDQLMELAGLSVATAIAAVYKSTDYNRVLVICGPGNNGGDGLVAARHLHHFGYMPYICYPKRTPKPLYDGLVTQLEALSVPFLFVEDLPAVLKDKFDIIVDALFGFSFHGAPRPPFDDLIQRLVSLRKDDQRLQESPFVISVDIPSGWHVEEGDVSGKGIKPDMLVSLTAPKLCAKKFCGPHHFLGGRFVPSYIVDKFKLRLPSYPGTSMCVRIERLPHIDILAARESHSSQKEQVETDPFDQFNKWFEDAVTAGLKDPDSMSLSTASKDGKPSSRMISLRGVDKDGFVWFTSYRSRKASELSENAYASLLFYWGALNRQVRVEGFVVKVSDEESGQYFHSLQRDVQIRPVISKQSTVLPGRQALHQQYKELEEKFSDGSSISRPKDWGGYRLIPEHFEFWQGEESHVQLKVYYSVEEIDGKRVWKSTQLSPKPAS